MSVLRLRGDMEDGLLDTQHSTGAILWRPKARLKLQKMTTYKWTSIALIIKNVRPKSQKAPLGRQGVLHLKIFRRSPVRTTEKKVRPSLAYFQLHAFTSSSLKAASNLWAPIMQYTLRLVLLST